MSISLEAPRMAVETQVVAKAVRQRFTAEEKLWVPHEADGCTKLGKLGALLRRGSESLRPWNHGTRNGVGV